MLGIMCECQVSLSQRGNLRDPRGEGGLRGKMRGFLSGLRTGYFGKHMLPEVDESL